MNSEQEELQFLGFFGILKESFNVIFSWRKIFSQITLALILPLSFIFLAHIQISQFIFVDILRDEDALEYSRTGTPYYDKLSDAVSSEWVAFWLFKAAYFTVYLVLSLLSTSAVVYTIACIYTGKEISFKKVMSVVPKVWKRLIVTFLWSFAVVLVYNLVAGLCLLLSVIIIGFSSVGVAIFVALFLVYLCGFVYITLIWQLASVVSVLEDVYGIQAMTKSRGLIKGKMGVALALFLLLILCFGGIQTVFEIEVAFFWSLSVGMRILIGVVCFLLLFKAILFGLVAETVLYFVCKSYHHENIDKSNLADHLEVYLGEYLPLKSKDVQLEQFHV
ncbi:hypothetical protein COLO4_35750 [Corchorus olitorius]|uniref:Polyadenylate-binding protein 1-B-binding protein n=1 Tax=Corchorus olitorius TaxID=93759 RepID=A0A1R3GDN8_9ROSI|nr:hypothetical protein COLO4_35750 [Corchorus olitorius]